MEIYKKGQGNLARWITAAGLGAALLFGCIGLYGKMEEWNWVSRIPGTPLTWSTAVIGLVVAGGAIGTGLLVNYPRFVDYLILSEAELRKVAWPTRQELKRQTAAVIITMAVMAALLFVTDLVLMFGFDAVYLRGLG